MLAHVSVFKSFMCVLVCLYMHVSQLYSVRVQVKCGQNAPADRKSTKTMRYAYT